MALTDLMAPAAARSAPAANPLQEAARLGQSIWYDGIHRALLDSGELARLVGLGVSGLTSNPTIMQQAIAGPQGDSYAGQIAALARQGAAAAAAALALWMEDIRRAAAILRPVYEQTAGRDGYASIEVPPELADDTRGTIRAALDLWRRLDLPNVLVKVPATSAGIPAIETLIACGVNVNVTLLFGVANYEQVAAAYLAGLERLAATGKPLGQVASVASVFVSRIDTAVDALLEARAAEAECPERAAALRRLQGQAGIAAARAAYARFRELFGPENPRWERLKAQGARVQRPLWASTSTKNPRYRDVLYVEELMGPDTVDTLPPATLERFLDHGQVRPALLEDPDGAQARATLTELATAGIDLSAVMRDLQQTGVRLFAESYQALLTTLAERLAAAGRTEQEHGRS